MLLPYTLGYFYPTKSINIMPQIELEEQDLEKVGKLIKSGIFLSAENMIKELIRSLLELSEEDLEKMKQAQIKVNSYCDSYLGNLLGAGIPLKINLAGKEYFQVPVKGEYEGRIYTYGHLFVATETLTVDEQLSDSIEKIHETIKQLTSYDQAAIV